MQEDGGHSRCVRPAPPGSARRKSRSARTVPQPPRVVPMPRPASVACTASADSSGTDHAARTRGAESLCAISGDPSRRAPQVGGYRTHREYPCTEGSTDRAMRDRMRCSTRSIKISWPRCTARHLTRPLVPPAVLNAVRATSVRPPGLRPMAAVRRSPLVVFLTDHGRCRFSIPRGACARSRSLLHHPDRRVAVVASMRPWPRGHGVSLRAYVQEALKTWRLQWGRDRAVTK
jgi:hypothetical protein